MRILSDPELALVAGGNASSDAYDNDGLGGNWFGYGTYGGGGGGGGTWYWMFVPGSVTTAPDGTPIVTANGGYWAYQPYDYNGGSNGGGSGQGGQGGPANPYEFTYEADDAICAKGAALKLGNHMHDLETTVGKYEFGSLIVHNADGSYGALDNGIHSDYSAFHASLTPEAGTDYSSIVGIVQNQPYNTSLEGFNDNYLNRYPSAGDWNALQALANNGANPAVLAIFITDPWGTTREFKLSDRAGFEAMTDSQRMAGQGLPAQTVPCGG